MNIAVEYFDNNVIIENEKVSSIEIENFTYFYKFVSDLIAVSKSEITDKILFYEGLKEINLSGKINVIIDWFNIDDVLKKYSTGLIKYISNNIIETEKAKMITKYSSFVDLVSKKIMVSDIDLDFNFDISFENIIKSLKISINKKDNLLSNIMLIIDLEKELKQSKILFFINVKQLLNKIEIEEICKYALYNEINICFVDSQAYGGCNKYERKLIIDEELYELMI